MKNTKTLKKNYEFKNVLTKGKYYAGKKIEVFIKEEGNKNKNKIGLAIGVKRGKAYARNRLKRLLRENYYKQEPKIKTGNSIVFLPKKNEDITQIKYKEIEEDMEKIFKQAKIFKDE